MSFYFERFEDRRPEPPVPHSPARGTLWQLLASISVGLGCYYTWWRWTDSINWDAAWFSLPLLVAETLAFVGLLLFVFNLWKTSDVPPKAPPHLLSEVVATPPRRDRPLGVDVFITTYNEETELVRLSIRDAKRLRYPHPIDVRIHVLDDGRRPAMQAVCQEEGVDWITRDNNIGYKAGNMRNGIEQTSGDFLVICDADTRPFPSLLESTLGYFRDPDVAWVQTPQWFYDLPEGQRLPAWLGRRLGAVGLGIVGRGLGRLVEAVVGPVHIGADPFGNDPRLFYEVILRRRNWANASFCCGAGSVHRREAVLQVSLREFSRAVEDLVEDHTAEIDDPEIRRDLSEAMTRAAAIDTEITPYKFHVSEDIYTSIVLHSDRGRTWKSVLHPGVESRMLSPQDLLSWTVQRFKYAGGTLDIARNDNPIFRRGGLRWPQKVMYGATIWSYLASIWNPIFLLAPIIYLVTGIPPVETYSFEFFKHLVPFLIANELATIVGVWGIASWQGQAFWIALFPVNLRALWAVLRGRRIGFPVTPKMKQQGTFGRLVWPQIAFMVATVAAMLFAAVMLYLGRRDNLAGVAANLFWGANNVLALGAIVRAAYWKGGDE